MLIKYEIHKKLNILNNDDVINNNNKFISPQKFGYTIYTKSNCYRCDELKDNINSMNNIFEKIYYINCDEYLNNDKECFKEFIAPLMNKIYTNDLKISFPIVFVNGDYNPKFFLL